ncbi:hypothetical protein NDU88_004243 [Pleurodeles waltl]|uniref:Uncharacterized protein n=1 Tax=Pleurodeles waltl TaxID=8319 RepID=A0AAV7VFM8_PLEWA|nr:hypothetical protein NDU88_004243 [Pleurodeles waltl]
MENRGRRQRRGTAPKNKGRHQEAVERPTEEGIPANVSGEEVPALSSPPSEEAPSDDSDSGLQDLEDLPGPSGTTGQPVTQAQSQTTTEPPYQDITPQHPPSVPKPLPPGHVNQQCAHLYREPRPHLIPKTIRDLGSVAVGTPFTEQRHRPTGKLGGLLCTRGRTGPGNLLSRRHSLRSWTR